MLRAIFILTLAPALAPAASISYTGTFDADGQIQKLVFTVNAPTLVVVRTWGYAGGTNGAGQTIAPGGFDPYLSLFEYTGSQALFAVNEDLAGCAPPDAVSHACLDAGLSLNLAAGRYVLVLWCSPNRATRRSAPP